MEDNSIPNSYYFRKILFFFLAIIDFSLFVFSISTFFMISTIGFQDFLKDGLVLAGIVAVCFICFFLLKNFIFKKVANFYRKFFNIILAFTLFIIFGLFYLFQPSIIKNASVGSGKYQEGQTVLGERITYLFSNPKVGDIVTFLGLKGKRIGQIYNIQKEDAVIVYLIKHDASEDSKLTKENINSKIYLGLPSKKQNLSYQPIISSLPTATTNIQKYEIYNYFIEKLGYSFEWDKENKKAKILKDKQEILNFSLEEKPINVYFNPSSDNVAIITVKNSLDEPHNLMVFSNGELKTLFVGKSVPSWLLNGELINQALYKWDVDEKQYQKAERNMHIKFSRDGNFISFKDSSEKIDSSKLININSDKNYFEQDTLRENPIGSKAIYWSPKSLNFILLGGTFGDETFLFGAKKDDNFKIFSLTKEQLGLSSGDYKIYWEDDDNGLIEGENNLYFAFDLKNKTFQKVEKPINFSTYEIDDGNYNLNLFHSLKN